MNSKNLLSFPVKVTAILLTLLFSGLAVNAAGGGGHHTVCTTSCSTCYGSYNVCDQTNCGCGSYQMQDPGFPKIIDRLTFQYNKTAPFPSPSTCSGANGTCSCQGTSSGRYEKVPLISTAGSACQVISDINKLPATINCRWNQYYCYTYCARSHTVSYTYSCNCVTTCH